MTEISFDLAAQEYIRTGVALMRDERNSDFAPILMFPLSRTSSGQVATCAPDGGPLVALGLIERHRLSDGVYATSGDTEVYVRFAPGKPWPASVRFSAVDGELTARVTS